MSSRRLAKLSLAAAIAMMVVSVGGFITALVLNAFFLDKYNAYGEVPIPGSGSVYLPAGDVTVSLHTVVISGPDRGLPVPPLGVTIAPPEGVSQPVVTESIGTTTTVNNDAHVRVWVARIAANGTYNVTTDGQVNGFIAPRLAFGHQSSYGFLVWLFVATFVAGLVGALLAGSWLARTRRRAVVAANPAYHAPAVAVAHEPTDEGVRLERLKTLAALRDSGALTDAEFEAEKRRVLEGR
ncbi:MULTISPECIES: SHOCT domain-containing protein [unclassified Mycobacterium]|uniref:SHOCT domain-containing protein n=1 Tax=unclassified Mycobacterium TaxID=2642494 RepID=UPI0006DC910B|nr:MULTISPECIES: SHOCT domain-containing protein [unclassified Mycobacterium]